MKINDKQKHIINVEMDKYFEIFMSECYVVHDLSPQIGDIIQFQVAGTDKFFIVEVESVTNLNTPGTLIRYST